MTQTEARRLKRALEKQFGGKAEFEPVDKKGRYRFALTSKRFEKMSHLKRQAQVWEVIDRTLSREANVDVSMILVFAPADLIATG